MKNLTELLSEYKHTSSGWLCKKNEEELEKRLQERKQK